MASCFRCSSTSREGGGQSNKQARDECSIALSFLLLRRDDVITTKQLEAALEALKGTSGDAKVKSLVAVLDEDHDGNISLNELAEVRTNS